MSNFNQVFAYGLVLNSRNYLYCEVQHADDYELDEIVFI